MRYERNQEQLKAKAATKASCEPTPSSRESYKQLLSKLCEISSCNKCRASGQEEEGEKGVSWIFRVQGGSIINPIKHQALTDTSALCTLLLSYQTEEMPTDAMGVAGGTTQLAVLQGPISLNSDWWEHMTPMRGPIRTRLPEGWRPQRPRGT